MPTSGERELIGTLVMLAGLLLWLGGKWYFHWPLWLLSEDASEWLGKVLGIIGAVLVVSALF